MPTTTPPITRDQIKSARLRALPPFLFNEIDNKKRAAIAAGKDVINLGVGDPDRPTPQFIIDAMDKAMRVPVNHQYPDCYGTKGFLHAAADFLRKRFGVTVDPIKNIVACIGSKDGISHLPLGVLNPGDGAIVFTPAYPVYAAGTIMAGGVVHRVPTSASTNWLPRLDHLSPDLLRAAKLMWLNYPVNPTGACASVDFLEQAVKLSHEHDIMLASDLAYSEIYFDHQRQHAPSILQAPSFDIERTLAIEFHSLSKTFNMTGWRIGFAVGHEAMIGALKQAKDNFDSGPFNAVQAAGQAALEQFDHPEIVAMRDEYAKRRDIVVAGLRAIGCEVTPPGAGIFVWARCPIDSVTGKPMESWKFAGKLIDEAGVVTVPGAGFADDAHDWFRVSLTRETPRIAQAMERLRSLKW